MTDQLKEAREGLAKLREHDPARADDAYRLLINLVEQAAAAAALLAELPPIYASYVEEDGSLFIEWTFEDRCLGFSFETNPAKSGWSYVTKSNDDDGSGLFKDMDLPALVRRALVGLVPKQSPG